MSLKNKKILIVDDDDDFRRIARHILETSGLIVDEANSVSAAMERIQNNPPQIVLTDLHMPEETGFDLIEKLLKQGILKKLPVIVLSSLNDVPSVRRAITLGVKDYVIKPLKTPVLLQKLRKVNLANDYVKIDLPMPIPSSIAMKAEIKLVGESGFQIQSAVKINPDSVIKINSELLKSLSTRFTPTSITPKYFKNGTYLSNFSFIGMNPDNLKKLRGWISLWKK